MRIIKSKITSVILLQLGVAFATAGFVGSALAFDPKAKSADVSEEQGPLDLFKFGFKAYKNGEKKEAIKAYKYAAEKGHRGARWAMANMYAFGDGVREDDYEAFKNLLFITRKYFTPQCIFCQWSRSDSLLCFTVEVQKRFTASRVTVDCRSSCLISGNISR